jgi:hypothetical protein
MSNVPPNNSDFNLQNSSAFPDHGGDSSNHSLQQEKHRILTQTLPEAYHALGKDCIQNKRHLECVPQMITELNAILAELRMMREVGLDKLPNNAGAKSNPTAFVILSERRNGVIAKIGLSIFNTHGDKSGPSELVLPIQNLISRIEAIATDSYPSNARSDNPAFKSNAQARAKEVLTQGIGIARDAFKTGTRRLQSTFGSAMKETIGTGFFSFWEFLAHPILYSFGTLVLIIACAFSAVGLITVILIPVFILGYIPYIQSVLKREPTSLGKFIGFMRHGWDSLWHLLMLFGAFVIAAAVAIAPFFIAGIIFYATVGTVGLAGLQAMSLVPTGTAKLQDEPLRNDPIRNFEPKQDTNSSPKNGIMTDILRAFGSLMENAAWVVAVLLSGLIATAVLTPSGAILILVYCISLMVTTRQPASDLKYDLVYEAFEQMLHIAQSRWKRLLVSGLWLVSLPVALFVVLRLLSALMVQFHLPFFAHWLFFIVYPLVLFGFVIYANIFSVKTAIHLVESREFA